ncbi:MAG: thioredoxin family protein [Flavobacteriaceae bacterium]|jgi:hypothetical protein|nr:thioredoxin family protein [Flavobacteriaceae bacterium]
MKSNTINLENYWNKAVSYSEYKKIIKERAEQNTDSLSGKEKEWIHFTKLNISRINRIEKTLVLSEDILSKLHSINHKINILVISEGWCGDAAQIVPVINKMAENSDHLELKLFFRDEDEVLINQYLTNGGKAIPIAILFNAKTFEEVSHWGPRPKACIPLLQRYKADPENYTHDHFVLDIQNFYNQDKGQSIANELIELFQR